MSDPDADAPLDSAANYARLVELEKECAALRAQLGVATRADVKVSEVGSEVFDLLQYHRLDMFSVHAADGSYLYASAACTALFGYPPGGLLGRSAYDFIHADDLDRVASHHAAHAHGENTLAVEYRFLRADGSYRWVETSASAIHRAGVVAEIVCVTRDVGERRALEEARIAALNDLERFVTHVHDAGLLPICAWCKSIREDDGTWLQVDVYLRKHAQFEFTHGVCPSCVSRLRQGR